MKFAEYVTEAYSTMNQKFWGGKLPDCLVTLQRSRGAKGYFAPERMQAKNGVVHEIALNPDTFDGDVKDITSTLLHEMVHLWQQEFGKPSRNGYHNKEWANEMLRVGLTPVSIDQPGKMTGQKVTHEIDKDGGFELLWEQMREKVDPDALLQDIWRSLPKSKATPSKVKYSCPSCDANAWAKPESNLMCGWCEERMESQE